MSYCWDLEMYIEEGNDITVVDYAVVELFPFNAMHFLNILFELNFLFYL